MNTRYLAVLATLAFLGFSVPAAADPCAGPLDTHKHCKDRGGSGGGEADVTYTADLTGAFVFNNEGMTANPKGTVLRGQADVTLVRDDGSDPALWNFVFAQCSFFLPPVVVVPSFTAPSGGGEKGWTIDKAGGISVVFRKIALGSVRDGPVEVKLYLIGTAAYEDDFLPVPPDTTITHELSRFAIWGQTVKGGTPGGKCHSGTGDGPLLFLDDHKLALTITATAPSPP